ncbi:hypothetical protein FQR65_LT20106 [Abscondita terminalis]|nr:hypothetical protein FQR65_LT20106 [Abscondita terminalis]
MPTTLPNKPISGASVAILPACQKRSSVFAQFTAPASSIDSFIHIARRSTLRKPEQHATKGNLLQRRSPRSHRFDRCDRPAPPLSKLAQLCDGTGAHSNAAESFQSTCSKRSDAKILLSVIIPKRRSRMLFIVHGISPWCLPQRSMRCRNFSSMVNAQSRANELLAELTLPAIDHIAREIPGDAGYQFIERRGIFAGLCVHPECYPIASIWNINHGHPAPCTGYTACSSTSRRTACFDYMRHGRRHVRKDAWPVETSDLIIPTAHFTIDSGLFSKSITTPC